MKIQLFENSKFWANLRKNWKCRGQNINFGGKNGSLEKDLGLEWNMRKVGGKSEIFD